MVYTYHRFDNGKALAVFPVSDLEWAKGDADAYVETAMQDGRDKRVEIREYPSREIVYTAEMEA